MIYAEAHHDEVPSFTQQTKFKSGLFRFGPFEQGRRIFNCALYNDGSQDWLIARVTEEMPGFVFGKNYLVAFRLTADHQPINGIKINFRCYKGQHWEDPRCTTLSGNIPLLSYCTFVLEIHGTDVPMNKWYGAHQGVSPLDDQFQPTEVYDPIHGSNGGSVLQNAQAVEGSSNNEKNWLWFQHEGRLHTVYMTSPHEVVEWGSLHEAPRLVHQTEGPCKTWWPYGQPRGGSPPVRVGDEYWSFFHSSTPWLGWRKNEKRRYHMAAYAFEAKPPFRITRFAKLPILTGSPRDPWAENQPLVIFPCGALLRNGVWLVTFGVNDMASGWIEIPHADLQELTPAYAETEENEAASFTAAAVPSFACGQNTEPAGVAPEQGVDSVADQHPIQPERADPTSGAQEPVPVPRKPSKRRMRKRRGQSIRRNRGASLSLESLGILGRTDHAAAGN